MLAEGQSVQPPLRRRIAALGSLALVAAVLVETVISVIDRPARLAVVLGLVAVMGLALWYALTRAGGCRAVAVAPRGRRPLPGSQSLSSGPGCQWHSAAGGVGGGVVAGPIRPPS